jgi:hypothetical protein
MNLTVDNSPSFLNAVLSGEFTLEEAERTFAQILEAVERYEATRVLVDGRGITGHPTTMERFYYGEFVAQAVNAFCQRQNRPTPKFSYVLIKPVVDDDRFGNTVAANRGMDVKTFEDVDAAVEWLVG